MMRVRDTLRADEGFSVAELTVAAFIGLLVLGVAYLVFETGMKGFRQVEGTTVSSRTAAECMMRIQRPLREATKVSTATEYEIQFVADPDDDDQPERLRFYIPAGTNQFKRDMANWNTATSEFDSTSTVVVADIVRNRTTGEPLFTYLDVSGNQLTGMDRLKARVVQVLFLTQANAKTPEYRVKTDIFLRNFME